jgi:hypothetical protein
LRCLQPVVVVTSPLLPRWKDTDCPPTAKPVARTNRPIDEGAVLHRSMAPFMQRTFNRTQPLSRLETDLLRLPLHVALNMSAQIARGLPFLRVERTTGEENLVAYYRESVAIGVQVRSLRVLLL